MKYKYSQIDKDNLSWFDNNMKVASLSELQLLRGRLRSLSPFNMEFKYPISVVAGRNRSGKSTILAMVACAFHNQQDGFKLPERRLPYYTFSDFLIQTSEEVPPEGIEIYYRIKYDRWKKSSRVPEGIGNLLQKRTKKRKGKWSNYSSRVKRNVIFFGIQRVVPHSEKSVSKSYKAYFTDGASIGWENEVQKAVGKILGTEYDSFKMKTHGKYRLPLVATRGNVYSGFNMGAGENALFEIFSTIYASPPGTLLVIDEIELGLHVDAQKKLISELKHISKSRYIQVICTTHSPAILDSIPPEGRFFVESYDGKTVVTPGISPQYAAGKLAGESISELDIYVEDGIAAHIIEGILPNDVRKRVSITSIGSPITIVRQMAARHKDNRWTECIAVMDGDQDALLKKHTDHFLNALETSKDSQEKAQWFQSRLAFLPGKTWPEKWMMQSLEWARLASLATTFQISEEELRSYIQLAKSAGKHNEIYSLANYLSLNAEYVCSTISRWLSEEKSDEFSELRKTIESNLL